MNKLKIVVVGCGRIAKTKHFQAIKDNEQYYDLVAVCDSDEAKAKEIADSFSIPYFVDLKEMLEQMSDIDIVSLCTPSGLHPEQAILAAEHGKHIISEKPMGCNKKDSIAMIQSANEHNVQLFVIKQNRLNPTVQALKQAVDNGDFGKIYLVHANVFWTRPQDYYDQAAWRGTWQYDGGAFMNQASHYVDLLDYLVGPIEHVQAMTRTLARDIEAEDSGVINLSWKNGAIGSMAVTMLTYPQNLEGSITILGEKGTARLDGVALNEIKIWEFEHSSVGSAEELSYVPDTVYGNGHGPYYENVAQVLLNNVAPISDGSSGFKSIKLLSAIYESAETGNLVKLADD